MKKHTALKQNIAARRTTIDAQMHNGAEIFF